MGVYFSFCGVNHKRKYLLSGVFCARINFTWGQDFNVTLVSQIYKGVGMTILIQKYSELGSNCSQYDSDCRRRLSIFFNQGYISEHCRHALKIVLDEDVFSAYFV